MFLQSYVDDGTHTSVRQPFLQNVLNTGEIMATGLKLCVDGQDRCKVSCSSSLGLLSFGANLMTQVTESEFTKFFHRSFCTIRYTIFSATRSRIISIIYLFFMSWCHSDLRSVSSGLVQCSLVQLVSVSNDLLYYALKMVGCSMCCFLVWTLMRYRRVRSTNNTNGVPLGKNSRLNTSASLFQKPVPWLGPGKYLPVSSTHDNMLCEQRCCEKS